MLDIGFYYSSLDLSVRHYGLLQKVWMLKKELEVYVWCFCFKLNHETQS